MASPSDFSPKAIQRAKLQIERKISGKRIGRQDPLNPNRPLSEEEFEETVQASKFLLAQSPQLRRDVARNPRLAKLAEEKEIQVRDPRTLEEEQRVGQSFASPSDLKVGQTQSFARTEDFERSERRNIARPSDLKVGQTQSFARTEDFERSERRNIARPSDLKQPFEEIVPGSSSDTRSTVSQFQPQGDFIERNILFPLSRFSQETEQSAFRGEDVGIGRRTLSFGAGFLSTLIEFPRESLQFGIELTRDPKKTITSIPSSFLIRGEEIGRGLRSPTPESTLGEITAEVAISQSPKLIRTGIVRTSDFIRTRGLKELPKERIIAPEFFEGSKFPSIKKGQTAGELLEEFKQPVLPGETRPAGFTASPASFKKDTVAAQGSSEFPGLFQAPKVSPNFLRILEGDRKVFTLKLSETLKPTIVRTTPQDILISPLVKSQQKSLAALKPTQDFFETAPLGKSFIPFVKTEKEAVIPAGTQLKQVNKRFFIKFEGRRIPIFEFEALGKGKRPSSLPTAKDISISLSSSRIGRRAAFDPLSSLPLSRFKQSTSTSTSLFKLTSSSFISKRTKSRDTSSIISSNFKPEDVNSFRTGKSSSELNIISPETNIPLLAVKILPPIPKKKRSRFKADLDFSFDAKPFQERVGRRLKRTPSFGAVIGKEFGIKTPKLSTGLEETGLFERARIKKSRQQLPALGPFKI